MVVLVRRGMSMRAVARQFRVSLPTVQRWVKRAAGHRLDRVDWRGQSSRPHRTRRTDAALENLVLQVRQELQAHSDLGEFGAVAIHRELTARRFSSLPSVRTIGRILARRGVLDARRRHGAGIGPWSPPETRSSIALMWAQVWSLQEGPRWRSSPVSRCMVGLWRLGP